MKNIIEKLSFIFLISMFGASVVETAAQTPVSAPSGLVGWWAGDGNANDISGSGNNGTFNGTSSFAVGKVGQNFNFTGIQIVQVPDNSTLDFTNAFTIETWVSPTAAGNSDGQTFFVSKGNVNFANTQSYGILFLSDRRILNRVGNGSTIDQLFSTTAISLDTFTHIAATYGGGTLRIYINGVLDNFAATSIGTLLNSSQPLIIGGADVNGSTVKAASAIDEVSLYNRALTDAEIQSIFNAGIAGKLKQTTTTGTTATVSDATITFDSAATRTTHEIPLDPTLFPPLPMGTHIGLIYDIDADVSVSNPTVCFNLPSFTPTEFPDLRVMHLENGAWINRTAMSNTYPVLCTNGLTSLSPFAIVRLAPTAAAVSVGGRVTSAKGRGIFRAQVSIVDVSGTARSVYTNPFGYYRFDEVPAGGNTSFRSATDCGDSRKIHRCSLSAKIILGLILQPNQNLLIQFSK